MSELDLPFLSELDARERLQFRNLALIRPQLPTEGQLRLIEGLARELRSPRLLTLIARTPHWLLHGPVLQALAENEATPESLRRDLEMAVSLVDLMREMDRAPQDEKDERAEMAKAVYAQLPGDLKPIVKQQLKQLAKQVNPTGFTQELPPLPVETPDWEALTAPPAPPVMALPQVQRSHEELLDLASTTHVLGELEACLGDPDPDIRRAALHNPMVSEDLLLDTLRDSSMAELFEEIYGEARWYFRDNIRESIYFAPGVPTALARKLRVSRELQEHLVQDRRDRSSIRRIAALFTQLEESEYQYITYWAKRQAPHLLRVVKVFYDRLQRRRTVQASGLGSHPTEGRWASLEERVFIANQATHPEQMVAALRDPDAQVFRVVLENPALTQRELVAAIPGLEQARVEHLATHPDWCQDLTIMEALLHNPNLSEASGLALLNRIDQPRALLDLLRDPRITHMGLKQRALEILQDVYGRLDLPHRLLALRSHGGELIRHLPQEVLKDEETLLCLVADRQLDPGLLLRLARNKQTPRAVLEHIAAHPIVMAHPPIMAELLLNPKTPREASARIWGLLSDTEQQQLLRSPHLPATLRHLANS